MTRQDLEKLSDERLLLAAEARNISNRLELSREGLISAILAWDRM